jgi:hypothetical protein
VKRAAVLLVAVLAALTSATAASVAAAAPAGDGSATNTLARCIEASRHLLFGFQIDRSGSLARNDPEDRRVDGISAALLGLERLTRRGSREDDPIRVDVLLSSFAGTVEPTAPASHWQRLDDGTLDGLLGDAEGYGDRDNSRDTDYVLAFQSVSDALDDRAAAVERSTGVVPCKAILFLSDGHYRIRDRTDDSGLPRTVGYAPGIRLDERGGGALAVAAGRRELCRAGGLMDRIAEGGAVTFTVALSSSSRFTAEDRRFLDALTTGAAGTTRCGTVLSNASGQFFDVRHARSLFGVIGSIVSGGGPAGEPVICLRAPCPIEEGAFDAVAGLAGFHVSASTPGDGVSVELIAPNGARRTLGGGDETVSIAETTVEQRWVRARSLDLEGWFDGSSDAWRGEWSVIFRDPAGEPARPISYELSLRSDVEPTPLGDTPTLVPGETVVIPVELETSTGELPADGELAESATVTASATAPGDGQDAIGMDVDERDDGTYELRLEVPDDAPTAGDWKIGVEVGFALSGGHVEPALAVFELDAGPPPPPWPAIALIAIALIGLAVVLTRWRRRQMARARFSPPQQLWMVSRDVEVSPAVDVTYDPATGPDGISDLMPVSVEGADRPVATIELAPFELRGRAPWWPGAAPRGEARVADGKLIGGTFQDVLPAIGDRRACEVPLDLSGTWLFAIQGVGDRGELSGSLVAFVSEDAPDPAGRIVDLLDVARGQLIRQDWDDLDFDDEESGDPDDPDAGTRAWTDGPSHWSSGDGGSAGVVPADDDLTAPDWTTGRS